MAKRAGRVGQSGTVIPERNVSVTVPNITKGDFADVALAADAAFKNRTRVDVVFRGATVLANLGVVGAYVSDPATGVVKVRFAAFTGNVATAAQTLGILAVD